MLILPMGEQGTGYLDQKMERRCVLSVDIARLLRTHSTDRSHPWSVDPAIVWEGRCTTSGCEWLSRLALWSVSVVAGKGLKFKFSVQTSMAEDTRTPLKQPITLGSSQPNLRYSCST